MYLDAVALTIFANSRLAGLSCPDFWPNALVFNRADKITFEAKTGRFLAAEDPADWVDKLRETGVLGFHVHAGLSNPISEAFVGGGSSWVVEAIRSDAIEHWTRVSAPPRECRFVRTFVAGPVCPVKVRSLDRLAPELSDVIQRAQSLLEQDALNGFEGDFKCFRSQFAMALESLRSENPYSFYSVEDCETNLPLPARQILAACSQSWLFGGMGSWNDVYPKPWAKDEYEDVTNDLYQLLIAGFCEAANSSFAKA